MKANERPPLMRCERFDPRVEMRENSENEHRQARRLTSRKTEDVCPQQRQQGGARSYISGAKMRAPRGRHLCADGPRSNNILSRPIAIYLLATFMFLLVNRQRFSSTEAGLIEVYHKYQAGAGAAGQAATGGSGGALQSKQFTDDGGKTMSTIEFSSPMKRIMDLIGHHAPVIVLDPSAPSSSSDDPKPSPSNQELGLSASHNLASQGGMIAPSHIIMQPPQAQPAAVSVASELHQPAVLMAEPEQHLLAANSQQQLLGQPQQQHWTILDTNHQMVAQHQHQHQRQLQQPLAQQQQLIQSAAIPNEQYFTFTPFGLAPSSSLFGGQQQSFIAYPQLQAAQQQQQQQQDFGQAPLPQSSQNHNQQQQQQQNEVQPVFLSSYVPELPAPPGSSSYSAPHMPGGAAGQFVVGPQSHQSQPNSIQQIQQAQQQQQQRPASVPAGGNASPESDSNSDVDTGSKSAPGSPAKDSDDEPPAATGGGHSTSEANSGGANDDDEPPSDEPKSTRRQVGGDGGDGEPAGGSGSMSYEDKYDSDKDDAAQQKSPSSPVLAAAASSAAGGLVAVGLNDDCLQCICRASSGCDHLLRCITIGAEEKYCGPFQLTEEYWQKAGSPGDAQNNFSSFEDCANDADCAVETVTNYMKKYYKDCDGDENVTCMDYARLHRLKPNECDQASKLFSKDLEGYWEKFQRCAEGYNRTRNGDDEDI